MKQIGMEMLETLSAAEFNRPYSDSVMKEVHKFFKLSPHTNPEMMVLGRIDWLPRMNFTVSDGILEISMRTLLASAILFLGRSMLENMIRISNWFTEASKRDLACSISHISTSFEITADILDVSLPFPLSINPLAVLPIPH